MKKLSSILSIIRKSQLLFVLMMIGLVFPQQTMSFPTEDVNAFEITEKSATEGEQPELFILKSSSMVTPASQAPIDHVFYEIMDIEYEVEQDFDDYLSIDDGESYLKILFRQVISPNAP
jgi:hypothetical protein